MSRNTMNFIADAASFLDLLGLTLTGYIIRYVLPSGTGGMGRALHGGGQGVHIKELWSMTRHEWGSIHFYMADVFVVLMIVHIVLHWTWVKHYVKSGLNR